MSSPAFAFYQLHDVRRLPLFSVNWTETPFKKVYKSFIILK